MYSSRSNPTSCDFDMYWIGLVNKTRYMWNLLLLLLLIWCTWISKLNCFISASAVYARRWIHKLWHDWVHAASSSGSHVRCQACQRRVRLQTWWRSWVCHTIWRCHLGGERLTAQLKINSPCFGWVSLIFSTLDSGANGPGSSCLIG